jgi:TetR/AcrR family transcriptional regulator
MHFLALGHDPVLGPLARDYYLKVFRMVRDEAHIPAAEATAFFAKGMLINILVALHVPDVAETDDPAGDLLACSFEGKEGQLIALCGAQPRLGPARRV